MHRTGREAVVTLILTLTIIKIHVSKQSKPPFIDWSTINWKILLLWIKSKLNLGLAAKSVCKSLCSFELVESNSVHILPLMVCACLKNEMVELLSLFKQIHWTMVAPSGYVSKWCFISLNHWFQTSFAIQTQ